MRDSPIKAVVLTNADVDHVTGLLTLRESQPLGVYATRRVLGVLAANSIFNVLNPEFVKRVPLTLDQPLDLEAPDGSSLGITVTPFAVPGKVALWLEDAAKGANFGSVEEDTIALEVREEGGARRLVYIPGCAGMNDAVAGRLRGADLVFFDGTLWVDDEMIREKVGVKTGRRMGHMSVSGPDGTMAALKDLGIRRKVFIHVNTTNPILLDDSPERRAVTEAGWEVARDGMELEL
jgi:pyrroloquinoline quinone biosynthesis protein B